jgi:aspartyl-tRNA(Asn)/glutamyl-tRNA(Gln) amidotransferase subunit C
VILEHAARVQEVAADDVPPTSNAVPRANVFRPDEPEPCLPHDEAMGGGPEQEADRFKVPRVIEVEDEAEQP